MGVAPGVLLWMRSSGRSPERGCRVGEGLEGPCGRGPRAWPAGLITVWSVDGAWFAEVAWFVDAIWFADVARCAPGVDRRGAHRREPVTAARAPAEERQLRALESDLLSHVADAEALRPACGLAAPRPTTTDWWPWSARLLAWSAWWFPWFAPWFLWFAVVIISVPPHFSGLMGFIAVSVELVVFVLLEWLM